MDSNCNTAQVGAGPSSNTDVDWRLQLQPDARRRIVYKIMDSLKRHVPVSLQEGSNEHQKTAVQFEETIYSVATSQSDYLRRISLWALSLETEAQPESNASLPNHNQINAASSMSNQMQQNQIMQQQQMLLQQRILLAQQQSLMLGSRGASNINNMQRQAEMLCQQRQQQQQLLLSRLQSQQQQTSMMQRREMQMRQQQMQEFSAQLQMQNNNAFDSQRQQQQQFILQQKQPRQQIVLQDFASSPASMDSTAQAFQPGDWQEEMYQKLKYLKETYFGVLREIHQKLSIKASQLDSVVPPDSRGGAQIEKMEHFKVLLERIMTVLSLDKDNLQIDLKDKIPLYEKQILCILRNYERVHQQQYQVVIHELDNISL